MGKQNRFSDLINILKGRVSTLPFLCDTLYSVSPLCPLMFNTTTIKPSIRKPTLSTLLNEVQTKICVTVNFSVYLLAELCLGGKLKLIEKHFEDSKTNLPWFRNILQIPFVHNVVKYPLYPYILQCGAHLLNSGKVGF